MKTKPSERPVPTLNQRRAWSPLTGVEAAPERTKERLLGAAFRVFGERGFHGASVREVCQRAHANIAAAHYYFHGKDKLYAAVVESAVQQLRATKPVHEVRHSGCRSPRQRLRAAIESLFECLTGMPDSVWLLRLVARELAEQGPAFDQIAAALRTHAAQLEEPLKELLGKRAPPDRIHLCSFSVISQCVCACAMYPCLRRLCPQLGRQTASHEDLVEHIVRFTSAAAEGIRNAREF